jgi:hypothetical protein
MRNLIVAVLLLALSTACSTPRVVRLDTGRGTPLEYNPSTPSKPLAVGADDFKSSLEQLVLATPLPLRASERRGLVRASYPSSESEVRWQRLISKSFGGLCQAGQRGENCLSVLDDMVERFLPHARSPNKTGGAGFRSAVGQAIRCAFRTPAVV